MQRVRQSRNPVTRLTQEAGILEEKRRASREIMVQDRQRHLTKVLEASGTADIPSDAVPANPPPQAVTHSRVRVFCPARPATASAVRTSETDRQRSTVFSSDGGLVSNYLPSPSPLKDKVGGFRKTHTAIYPSGPRLGDRPQSQRSVHINDFGQRAGLETEPYEAPKTGGRKLTALKARPGSATHRRVRPLSAGVRGNAPQ